GTRAGGGGGRPSWRGGGSGQTPGGGPAEPPPPNGTKLDKVLASAAEIDLALLAQPPGDGDDVGLRLLDVLQLDRAHHAEIVLQDLGGRLRDVGEDLVLHPLARRLEGEEQVFTRDLLQELLHLAVFEP